MHRHACDYGHYWECAGTAVRLGSSEPTICMCLDHGVPMEQDDHSTCSIEVLTCPEHRAQQLQNPDGRVPIKEDEVEDGFVPIKIPDNFDEMLEAWNEDKEPSVGLCLMCGQPIRTMEEFIPGTHTHNCAAGRAFEKMIAAGGPTD